MFCDLESTRLEDGRWHHRCKREGCSFDSVRPAHQGRLFHICDLDPDKPNWIEPRKNAADCIHRGLELRREQCQTCSGEVKIKVFACPVHGECAIDKTPPGVVCCATCEAFSEKDPSGGG